MKLRMAIIFVQLVIIAITIMQKKVVIWGVGIYCRNRPRVSTSFLRWNLDKEGRVIFKLIFLLWVHSLFTIRRERKASPKGQV